MRYSFSRTNSSRAKAVEPPMQRRGQKSQSLRANLMSPAECMTRTPAACTDQSLKITREVITAVFLRTQHPRVSGLYCAANFATSAFHRSSQRRSEPLFESLTRICHAFKIKDDTTYLHHDCSSLRCRPFTGPEWRNGRRAGFKIPYPSLGVWVRLPPSVLFLSVITDSQSCSEPRISRGFRVSGGGRSAAKFADTNELQVR